MPSISAIGSFGGMSGISAMYNNRISANRQADYAASAAAARTAAANPSQPNAPVEPVSAVRAVAPDASVRMPVAVQEPALPTVDDLNNASDNLARMRIEYPEAEAPQGLDALTQQREEEPTGLEALTQQREEELTGLEALTQQPEEEPAGLEALTRQPEEEPAGLEALTQQPEAVEAQGAAAMGAQFSAAQNAAQVQTAIGINPLVTKAAGVF